VAGRQWRAELCDAADSQSSPLQIKNRQSGSDRRAASIFVKCDENRVSKEELPGHERLQLYLNDHLAGSVAAIELIDNLIWAIRKTGSGIFFALYAKRFTLIRRSCEI
jgi:hypothetical protein